MDNVLSGRTLGNWWQSSKRGVLDGGEIPDSNKTIQRNLRLDARDLTALH
jgi:hypothetical protein